jgi:hypothetical protein
MPKKSVVIAPPTPQEITRVAKALYAAAHVNEGLHGRTISPWSTRLDDDPHSRRIWEGLAIAAIDMAVGYAARI